MLRAHPEWADTQVGEDLQAFSDFLFYVLNGSNALLSELAIAVFDSTSGGVELYRGLHYPDPSSSSSAGGGGSSGSASGGGGERPPIDEEQQRANLLCIKYLNDSSTPGWALPGARAKGAKSGRRRADARRAAEDALRVRRLVRDHG